MNPEVRTMGQEANRQRGIERARAVMALVDRGLSVADIAAELGVTVPSARTILTRARRRLGLPNPRAKAELEPYRTPGQFDLPSVLTDTE